MQPPVHSTFADSYFRPQEQEGRMKLKRLRNEQAARVLKEQRVIRFARAVIVTTLSASALTGIATLLMMT